MNRHPAAWSRRLRSAILLLLVITGAKLAWQEAMTAVEASASGPSASEAPPALHRQPLDAATLRTLALAPGIDKAHSELLLRLSDTVNRRDRQTQLHLLNRQARAGNFEAALVHYDALLSTTPQARQPLYGVLIQAMGVKRIREGLAHYAHRDWFRPFLVTAAGQAGDPRQALVLARTVGALSDVGWRNEIAGPLISGLVATGAISDAQAIADGLALGDWQSMGFSPATMDDRLGSFAWRLESQGGASANLYAAGILAVTAEPQRRARVAKRLATWPPGRYRLSYVVEASGGPMADVTWRVSCPGSEPGDAMIAAQPAPAGSLRSVSVTLSRGCIAQEWGLWVEGADSQTASAALVSRVAVEAL